MHVVSCLFYTLFIELTPCLNLRVIVVGIVPYFEEHALSSLLFFEI